MTISPLNQWFIEFLILSLGVKLALKKCKQEWKFNKRVDRL